MAKVLSIGIMIGGLALVFFVAPTFMECATVAGVPFCNDTPTSYATMGIGGLLLLVGTITFAIVMNREFQKSLKNLPERPLSQDHVKNDESNR